MRTDYQRGLSDRERAAMREQMEFQQQFDEQRKEAEERALYDQAAATFEREQERYPETLKVRFPSFPEFRALLPANGDGAMRSAMATNKFLLNISARTGQSLIASTLSDEDLEALRFDLSNRHVEGSPVSIRPATMDLFKHSEPDFDSTLHSDALADFLAKHRLAPTAYNLGLSFRALAMFNLLPAPEPEPTSELNEHRENLPVKADDEYERRKAREKYRTQVVVVDPVTGRAWTQYQIDTQMDSSTFKRLFLGDFRHEPSLTRGYSGGQQ